MSTDLDKPVLNIFSEYKDGLCKSAFLEAFVNEEKVFACGFELDHKSNSVDVCLISNKNICDSSDFLGKEYRIKIAERGSETSLVDGCFFGTKIGFSVKTPYMGEFRYHFSSLKQE